MEDIGRWCKYFKEHIKVQLYLSLRVQIYMCYITFKSYTLQRYSRSFRQTIPFNITQTILQRRRTLYKNTTERKKDKKKSEKYIRFLQSKKEIKKKTKFPFSHNIFVPWTRNRSIRSNHFFCTFRRQRTINHSLQIPKHKQTNKQTNNTHTKNKTRRRRKKNISTKKKTQNKNNSQHKKKKSSFHILQSTTHLFILRQRVFPSTISFKTTTPIPTLIPLNPNPTISSFFIKFISSMRH